MHTRWPHLPPLPSAASAFLLTWLGMLWSVARHGAATVAPYTAARCTKCSPCARADACQRAPRSALCMHAARFVWCAYTQIHSVVVCGVACGSVIEQHSVEKCADCSAVQCIAVQRSAVQHGAVQHGAVQHGAVQCGKE